MKIAIHGPMCSGKTTISNIIKEIDPEYKTYSFGLKVKDIEYVINKIKESKGKILFLGGGPLEGYKNSLDSMSIVFALNYLTNSVGSKGGIIFNPETPIKEFKVSEGDQLRDFCYIDDTINAIYKILFSKKTKGKILNIGSGRPITIKKMIKKVVKLIGSGKPIFGAFPYRKGENMSLYANIDEIKQVLKWKPKISLEEGLNRTIK